MADLVWLHEGALRLTHPVFAAGGPDAATIFIWDRDRLAASHVGIFNSADFDPHKRR